MAETDIREKLILATLEFVKEKNLKFTMDDLAKRLGISKKTIYVEFKNKEELITEGILYYFRKLKLKEREVILDSSLSTVEKLKKVLIVMPDNFLSIDFSQMAEVREKFPSVYSIVEKNLDTGWEPTLNLYRIAVEEGKLKKVPDVVFKLMVEGAMKQFLATRELEAYGVTYLEALDIMVDVIFKGLEIK